MLIYNRQLARILVGNPHGGGESIWTLIPGTSINESREEFFKLQIPFEFFERLHSTFLTTGNATHALMNI